MTHNKKVNSESPNSSYLIHLPLLADEVQAKGQVHTSTTGTAHNVSAAQDTQTTHGTTVTKVEVKTTGTDKPPLV